MRPLILTKSTKRRNDKNKSSGVFGYDYSIDMNVRNGKPFVSSSSKDECELLTKTEEYRERDDEDFSILMETYSKTFENRERDDEDDYYHY